MKTIAIMALIAGSLMADSSIRPLTIHTRTSVNSRIKHHDWTTQRKSKYAAKPARVISKGLRRLMGAK